MKSLAYGIDFGTTNTTVALLDSKGRVKHLPLEPNTASPSIMRSVIFADQNQQFLFGSTAVKAYNASIATGKKSTKKTINTGKLIKISSTPSARSGFKPDQIVPEIIEVEVSKGGRLFQGIKSLLGSNQLPAINVFGQTYTVEELIGLYLKEVKSRADKQVGQSVTNALIGRPVTFVGGNNTLALQRMRKALKLAGFKNYKFEYEPIGAALNYGHRQHRKETVLVFDFGGGTLDISIVSFPGAKVLATIGLPIGGDYFNSQLFSAHLAPSFGSTTTYGIKNLPLPRHIFDHLQDWFHISLLKTESFFHSLEKFAYHSSNPQALKALSSLVEHNLGFSIYEDIEKAKITLSTQSQTLIHYQGPDISIDEQITRQEFETLITPDLNRIKECILKALASAKISQSHLSAAITTGGSSLIPSIQHLLISQLGPERLYPSDVYTSVASGLAIKAKHIYS